MINPEFLPLLYPGKRTRRRIDAHGLETPRSCRPTPASDLVYVDFIAPQQPTGSQVGGGQSSTTPSLFVRCARPLATRRVRARPHSSWTISTLSLLPRLSTGSGEALRVCLCRKRVCRDSCGHATPGTYSLGLHKDPAFSSDRNPDHPGGALHLLRCHERPQRLELHLRWTEVHGQPADSSRARRSSENPDSSAPGGGSRALRSVLNVVRAPSLSWLGPLSFCPSPPSGLPSPSERAGRLLGGMAQG